MFLALFIVVLSAAALVDARFRICPNGLSAALAVVAVAYVWQVLGLAAVCQRAFFAALICAVLVAFELVWRRISRRAGIGMGDVKVLFSLMVVNPQLATLSFCIGLIALAMFCAIRRQGAAPLLPFISGCFLLAHLVFAGYRLWA